MTIFEVVHRHIFESAKGACPLATRDDIKALEKLMSALSDKVDKVRQDVADMKARVMQDIDDLKAQVAAGATPQEVLNELDAISADLGGFDPIPNEPPTP